jgi:hypothetical protein
VAGKSRRDARRPPRAAWAAAREYALIYISARLGRSPPWPLVAAGPRTAHGHGGDERGSAPTRLPARIAFLAGFASRGCGSCRQRVHRLERHVHEHARGGARQLHDGYPLPAEQRRHALGELDCHGHGVVAGPRPGNDRQRRRDRRPGESCVNTTACAMRSTCTGGVCCDRECVGSCQVRSARVCTDQAERQPCGDGGGVCFGLNQCLLPELQVCSGDAQCGSGNCELARQGLDSSAAAETSIPLPPKLRYPRSRRRCPDRCSCPSCSCWLLDRNARRDSPRITGRNCRFGTPHPCTVRSIRRRRMQKLRHGWESLPLRAQIPSTQLPFAVWMNAYPLHILRSSPSSASPFPLRAPAARCAAGCSPTFTETPVRGASREDALGGERPPRALRARGRGEASNYQLWMMLFANRPEAESCASVQLPEGLAPRTSCAAPACV